MKYTAIVLMFISIIARILGFIREILMSNFYGTSPIAEVVVIALAVPTVLFAFLFSSLNTSFIPSYNRVREERGDEEANIFTANVSNVVMIFSIILCLIGIIFARAFVFAMASGFTGEKFELAVKFVRIVLIGSAFNCIAAIFCGYLNVHGKFIVPALRAIVQNFILIIFTIISVKTSYYFLAIGILVATISQNLIVIPNLRKAGYKHIFKVDLKDPNIKYILMLALPLMLGVAVDQINVFVDKTLASRTLEGGVAMLNYADRVNALVYIVFTSIVTVAYPVISKYAIKNDMDGLKRNMLKYAQINYLFCIPIVAAFIVFSKPIIQIIYQRGAFTHSDTMAVSACLTMYSITMLGSAFREIISRTFYCLGDSKTPVKNGMVMVFLNAILSIILSRLIGLEGIALGTSIASIIGALTLPYRLRKIIGRFNFKKFIFDISKIVGISVFIIFISKLLFDFLLIKIGLFNGLFISAIFGAIVYFILVIIMDISDSRRIFNNGLKRLKIIK